MAAVVEFETLPELYDRLEKFHAGHSRTALRYKDRTTHEWTPIRWEELGRRVRAMAAYLYRRGVRKGDRVAILSENRPEWTIVEMATQRLGAINVSLYTSLPASQVGYILHDSGARIFVVSTGIQLKKAEETFGSCPGLELVVTMSEMRKEHPAWVVAWDDAEREGLAYYPDLETHIDELTASVKPSDVAALIYTSGTTGTPKGAMLSHRNFCSNARSALELVPFGPSDHHLSFLPLCHVFERLAGYTAVLAAGAEISYAESINTVSRNLPELRPTVLISVPRLFERIYNLVVKSIEEGSKTKKRIFEWAVQVGNEVVDKGRPSAYLRIKQRLAHRMVFERLHERLGGNLRFAVSGGAALPSAIGRFFQASGVTIIEGYGLTETAPVLTINPHDDPRFGTVGRVIPGVTIGIQDLETREMVAALRGEDYPSDLTCAEGEIIVKGPNVMLGYWNNREATAECIDKEGWFHTGDVGQFEDGRLRITDRIKHMIVSKGGKNIYPGPIEDYFKSVPWIDQILVVGEGREFLSALVVPDDEMLRAFAREKGIRFESTEELYAAGEILALFEDVFKAYSRESAAHEKIRSFRLIENPFTVEEGTMTPTLKLRRRVIEERYADLIDKIYEGVV